MKKLIAKTQEGKEFYHSKASAFFTDGNAQKMVNAMNEKRYQLKDGEKWHVYDYDFMQEGYVTYKLYIYRGNVKMKPI